MQETGSLKIVYSVSERERARLTRRMCAYIPKRDKRRRLAVSLLVTALLLVLYYGFFHNWQAALDYLGSVGEDVCEALCDESGQTAEDWDGLISGAAAARSHVAGLMYWMAALVLFVSFYMNWSWRKHIASLFDSLEGKQFSLEIACCIPSAAMCGCFTAGRRCCGLSATMNACCFISAATPPISFLPNALPMPQRPMLFTGRRRRLRTRPKRPRSLKTLKFPYTKQPENRLQGFQAAFWLSGYL